MDNYVIVFALMLCTGDYVVVFACARAYMCVCVFVCKRGCYMKSPVMI